MPPKKAAGRPRRVSTVPDAMKPVKSAPAPKKRGRPAATLESDVESPPPKKRGRPAKAAPAISPTPEEEDSPVPAPKKRGRPSKGGAASPAPARADVSAPKKPGRPPKRGKTTMTYGKIAPDVAQPEAEATSAKSRAKKGNSANEDSDVLDAVDSDTNSRNYWLMKAEQEDRFEVTQDGTEFNAKFTIDDLRNKDVPEPWDGVRNHVAAKNMKAMSKGDLAFFYASGGKSGRKPGITGIMEIVSEAEQDPSVYDASSYGYVENKADREKWVIVKVEFRKKLSKPVSLKELQKYQLASGVLDNMQLFKQSRLSVSRVTEKEWDFISDNLIEGYERDTSAEDPKGKEEAIVGVSPDPPTDAS